MSDGHHAANATGPVAWMARHGVAANLVMWVFLVGGLIIAANIKQEVFPDVALDTVSVTVDYPGASPEEVESGILLAVEEAIRNLDGIDEIISMAREGSGVVTAEILVGANVQKVGQDVKSEIDRIVTFPEEAEEPEVTIDLHRREVLSVVVYGDASDVTLHQVGEQLRDFMLQSPEVTQVDLEGVPPLEIGIEVSQENLRRYNTTLGDIAARLGAAAADVPGGGLKTSGGEVLVRLKERRDYGGQFAELPVITTDSGSRVLLRDIAAIDDSFADTDRYSLYNGRPAVLLDVYRIGNETPIRVAEAARQLVAEYQPFLPPGIETAFYFDRSETYKQRLDLLLGNGFMGLFLVILALGVFLEARLAFWVMMNIPVAFLGSFLFLPMFGVTINMMSMFAYIVALGVVVDNGIVVGENAYHYRNTGMGFLDSAVRGAREVAVPVVYSALTNIASFVPIFFIPGTTGKTFKMIPVVVCIVFLVSLVESLFVLPAHLGHTKERREHGISGWLHRKQQAFSKTFLRWVRDYYGPFVDFTMRRRYLTIACAVALLLVVSSYALSGRMGFQLYPIVESDFADGQVSLPYGTPVERTEAVMERLRMGAERVLADSGHPELVKAMIADIGEGGSHVGRIRVELAEPDIRNEIMSTQEFTDRWRAAVGEIPGVEFMRFASDSGGPGGRGRPLQVELSHRSIDVLERASTELADIVGSYPGVADVDDGFQPGKEQLNFTLKPEGKSLGLTPRDVARQVRNAFYGAEVLRQQRGRNEIKVMVRLPERDRATEQTLRDLQIRTPKGAFVPFREIAEVSRGRAYTTIDRRNGRRVVEVTADIVPRSKAGEVLKDLRENVLPEFERSHPGLSYSFEGHQADIRDSMSSLKVTFALALLAIYALLAIPFRSYAQPLVVMLSIPFGVVGAILGHLIMGYDLCIPSVFGIVALSGVVVNASLILIDFANNYRREGAGSAQEAIHAAALQRFRPIMLTTLTTFGGLAPMIFETSRQAQFLIPMALSLGYGILFATLITLIIVPSLYVIVDDAKTASSRGWRGIIPQRRPAPAQDVVVK